MTKDDALRMMLGPFKAWRDVPGNEDVAEELTKIITAVEKVLAQETALQVLHSENERLGLYKDAYAEPVARYSDIVSDGGFDPRNKFDAQVQRKPLTDEEAFKLVEQDNRMEEYVEAAVRLIRRTEAAHGIKENT